MEPQVARICGPRSTSVVVVVVVVEVGEVGEVGEVELAMVAAAAAAAVYGALEVPPRGIVTGGGGAQKEC